jgi:hypothetical protein
MSFEVVVGIVAAIAALVGTLFGGFLWIGTAGWWLKGQFLANREHTTAQVSAHEQIDQARQREILSKIEKLDDEGTVRHEENLNRFRDIDVRLARMGNGHIGYSGDDN